MKALAGSIVLAVASMSSVAPAVEVKVPRVALPHINVPHVGAPKVTMHVATPKVTTHAVTQKATTQAAPPGGTPAASSDINSLVFTVMQSASKDANADLKATMQGVKNARHNDIRWHNSISRTKHDP